MISRLQIVFINLKREERPHQIFESLNARGMDLLQPDLVRNYLAMRLPQAEQDYAYESHWAKIESLLDDRRSNELTNFLHHYLARCTGQVVNQDAIYSAFRERMERDFRDEARFRAELGALHRHASFYDRLLRPHKEADKALRSHFERLNSLNRTVIYPLLLSFYDAYERELLSHAAFCDVLDLVENYLVRHFLAYGSVGGLNRMFPSLIDDSRAGDVEHLKRRLLKRNYPTDNLLRRDLRYRNMYTRTSKRIILVNLLSEINRNLSRGEGVETILTGNPTVEHVMPNKLTEAWRRTLGRDHERIHRELLNTLGNLTLVTQEWNSALSNSDWAYKRARLQKHGLPLNSHYFGKNRPGDVSQWFEKAILARTDWLVQHFCKRWPDLASDLAPEDESIVDPERHPHPAFNYTNSGITSFTLRGEMTPIPGHSWNNAAQLFSDLVAVPRSDFEDIASHMSGSFSRSSGNRKLKNGWWLRYMGSDDTAKYLGELAEHCGLDDRDWSISVKFYD